MDTTAAGSLPVDAGVAQPPLYFVCCSRQLGGGAGSGG